MNDILFYFYFFIFFRESTFAHTHTDRGRSEGEVQEEFQSGSMPRAEPDSGLNLMTMRS